MNNEILKGNEIPYTFNVPSSYEEFLKWIEGKTYKELEIIIYRIRTCNHIRYILFKIFNLFFFCIVYLLIIKKK